MRAQHAYAQLVTVSLTTLIAGGDRGYRSPQIGPTGATSQDQKQSPFPQSALVSPIWQGTTFAPSKPNPAAMPQSACVLPAPTALVVRP
jgi:hypothetical protein